MTINKPEKNIILIPSSIFKDRNLSVLESLVEYLHTTENMTYHEIAKLLNRDDRTIWTVFNRSSKKRTTQQNGNGHAPIDISKKLRKLNHG